MCISTQGTEVNLNLPEFIDKKNKAGWAFEIRPYQVDAMKALNRVVAAKLGNSMLVLPTGGGKTATAMIWLDFILGAHPKAKVLWIVHRETLIGQAIKCLQEVDPNIGWSKWTADSKSIKGQIVFAMMLSSRNYKTAAEIHNTKFDIVIIDEGHMLHTGRNTYQLLFHNNIEYKFILGLTATPVSPKTELDVTFNNIAYQITFIELVKQGYLSKPIYIRYKTGIKWGGKTARTSIGNEKDFTDEDLKKLNRVDRNEMIVKEYTTYRKKYGKTVCFAVDINHAKELVEDFRAADVTCDMLISGMPDKARKQILKDFTDDKLEVLINIMILIEGWDVPSIRTVFLTRPTYSERLYMQMIGRGSRIIKGVKTEFYIVDFVDQCDKYALATEEWAIKTFNAKPDPENKDARDAVHRKELVDRLQDRMEEDFGFSKGIKARLSRELMNIRGVLTFSNENERMRNKRTVITQKQVDALDKMLKIMMNPNFKMGKTEFYEWVDMSYQRCVTRGRYAEFNIRQWYSISWAMYKKFKEKVDKIDGDTVYKYHPIELE